MANLKGIVPDMNQTFGDLMFLGKEDKFNYEDGKKTDEVVSADYKLASSVQGGEVVINVKVNDKGELKDFNFMAKVGLKGVLISTSAMTSGSFASVRYKITADEIFPITAGSK